MIPHQDGTTGIVAALADAATNGARRSAVAFVAHADDETLGCGGTLALLAKQGWDVAVVVAADGIITARPGGPTDLTGAAAAACDRLGLAPPRFLGWPDQGFDRLSAAHLAAAAAAAIGRPDLLITHSRHDLNLDHRIVAEAALVAVRPPGRPVSVLAAEVPGEWAFAGAAVAPSYYVDVSTTLTTKTDAFAAYGTEQREEPHPRSVEGIRRLALWRGSEAGLDAAEAFEVVRAFPGGLPGEAP